MKERLGERKREKGKEGEGRKEGRRTQTEGGREVFIIRN